MATMMQAEVLTEYAWWVRGVLMRLPKEVKKSEEYVIDDNKITDLIIKYQRTKAEDLNWEEEVRVLQETRSKYEDKQ
jgi:hypothetical protein